MAGCGFAAGRGGGTEFEAKITPIVIIYCIMAAIGGLMFGYDIGISGWMTSMSDFQNKFFPMVYNQIMNQSEDQKLESNYCKYNNQGLMLFIFSMYLAGSTATFFASYTTRNFGRRLTMLIAGVFFIVGVIFNAAAQDLPMLIVGRILHGCGVGVANQVILLFLSEIAPTKIRGSLNTLFQLNISIGILFANLVSYGIAKIKGGWRWRLSLGLAGIRAGLLTVGTLMVVDTPNSLIERGHLEQGKAVLKKIRGTNNVNPEFLELIEASRIAKQVKHPFRNLLMRHNCPQLIIAVALQVFQQFTGINAIMFYAPMMFKSMGFGNDASLYCRVIIGIVNVVSTLVAIYSVDKLGRCVLLLVAGTQMFLSQVIIAIVLGIKMKEHGFNNFNYCSAIFTVILICIFVSAFAWSWGPLGWLIPSETFPLETRSAGQSVTVCVNLFVTVILGQTFWLMFCRLKYGIFLFFSVWVLLMSSFVLFLVPETKNIPIEEMADRVWRRHWLWKRFMDDEDGTRDIEVV